MLLTNTVGTRLAFTIDKKLRKMGLWKYHCYPMIKWLLPISNNFYLISLDWHAKNLFKSISPFEITKIFILNICENPNKQITVTLFMNEIFDALVFPTFLNSKINSVHNLLVQDWSSLSSSQRTLFGTFISSLPLKKLFKTL